MLRSARVAGSARHLVTTWTCWGEVPSRHRDARASSLCGKFLQHVPEFLVELGRLLQHGVVADTVDEDRPVVGIFLVDVDGRRRVELKPATGVDAPDRHL